MTPYNHVYPDTNQPSETLPKKISFIEAATVPFSIKFENLSYSVKENRSIFKQLLNGINGQFSSGDFSAIIGESGAGKTTLLNILSGYVKENVKGTIKINGETCEAELLRKLSTYIMQNYLVQPHLSVEEQMMIVAKLKLPNKLEEKKMIVNELLEIFTLQSCSNTSVEKLSGGERKKFSIALELISNPPVIFLDEPTSGLDKVNRNLCIEIFKQLSSAGRTVICTIHQPSVSVMNQFDQVYFLSRGSCIYNGSTENMLPFLNSLNLICPITWSYSEFIIETVQTNPEAVQVLSNAIENGRVNHRTLDNVKNKLQPHQNQRIEEYCNSNTFHPSFWSQFTIIFHRMLLQQSRNKVGLMIQLFTHIVIVVIYGSIFFGIGKSADSAVSNIFFIWICLIFFMFNPIMTYITVFPVEIELLKREYLNRWYSFNAYFLAMSFRMLPNLLVFSTGMLIAIYVLTDQPMEIDRFFRFTLSCIMMSLTSEGLGLAIGIIFGTMAGSVVGPCCIAGLFAIPFHGFGYGSYISATMQILLRISYMRFGVIAAILAVMENRLPLNCHELFCYYKDPNHMLRDIGILNSSYYFEILGLAVYGLVLRIASYLLLRRRIQQELTGKNSDLVAAILNVKK